MYAVYTVDNCLNGALPSLPAFAPIQCLCSMSLKLSCRWEDNGLGSMGWRLSGASLPFQSLYDEVNELYILRIA